MENSFNSLKMKNGMTLVEFNKVLDDSVLDTKQKSQLVSIFNRMSNDDGIMNSDDWNVFIENLDKNQDGEISKKEWNNIVNSKKGFLKGLQLSDLKMLYNIVLKYINSDAGDNYSKKIIDQLEQENLGNEIKSIDTTEKGDVIVTFKNKEGIFVLRQYDKNGKLTCEIKQDEKSGVSDITEYNDNLPLISKQYDKENVTTILYDGNGIAKQTFTETNGIAYQCQVMTKKYKEVKAKIEELRKNDKTGAGVLNEPLYDLYTVKLALKNGLTFEDLELYYSSSEFIKIISNDNIILSEYYINKLNTDLEYFEKIKNHLPGSDLEVNIQKPINRRAAANVFFAQPNKFRAKSAGDGTFDGKWLQRDSFNSRTYEEWLKNNQYEFDVETAEVLNKKALRKNTGSGYCAEKTRLVLNDTIPSWNAQHGQRFFNIKVGSNDSGNEYDGNSVEFTDYDMYAIAKGSNLMNNMQIQGSAYKYASELANNPYFREIPHNIVSTMNLKTLPKGCIIVYDANYKTSVEVFDSEHRYHKHGHIAISDGKGHDSGDGLYNIVDKKQATHIRVFIPVKPKQMQK